MEPLDQSWRKFELMDFFYFCGIAADCHKNEKRPKMKPRKRNEKCTFCGWLEWLVPSTLLQRHFPLLSLRLLRLCGKVTQGVDYLINLNRCHAMIKSTALMA